MPKKSSVKKDDELRPEYDFRVLSVVSRGPGRKQRGKRTVLGSTSESVPAPRPGPADDYLYEMTETSHEITVRLAPDVAETFPDSDSVNEALRFLIRIAKGHVNTGRRST